MRNKAYSILLFAGILAILPSKVVGGEPVVEWEKTFGGSRGDRGLSVQQTTDGGYVVAGSTGAGGNDVYLIKTDLTGNMQWEKTFELSGYDRGNWAQQTFDGGYIITGSTSDDASNWEVFLIKTDSIGNIQWQKILEETDYEIGYGYSVQQTFDGGYIITGYWYRSYNPVILDDVLLMKTDSAGNIQWRKTFGGTGFDRGWSVQQTSDGGYIIAGETNLPGGGGAYNVYLIKTDSAGNSQWQKTFGGSNSDYGSSVQQTSDGGFIIAGGTCSFGAGDWDVYLIKTDSSGNLLWQKTYGGSGWDEGESVQQTADGGYIIAGSTGIIDYDPWDPWGLPMYIGDVYLIKTDSSGDKIWQKTFGGSDADWGYSVQQTTDGGYIIAGTTSSFGAGFENVYLIKLAPETGPPEGCDNYADLGNLEDEASHNLQGWDEVGSWGTSPSGDTTARCMRIGADNYLYLYVPQTSISYLLTAEVLDGECNDSFEIYVNGKKKYFYESDPSDGITIETHLVAIRPDEVTHPWLFINFKSIANDLGCRTAAFYYGRAPVYNVKLIPYYKFILITDVYATGYYCVYNSEIDGTQTITKTISGQTYTLKASFLFGGWGVAMQGTGRTGPDGDYIKYRGGGGPFVYIEGPDAGKNLEGQWVIDPDVLRDRYARLGITDFTGFGNLALLYPAEAIYSKSSSVIGSSERTLRPWYSVAVHPSLLSSGETGTLLFKGRTTTPYGTTQMRYRADDTGGAIEGKRIDIYLGEGDSSLQQWYQTGGDRYVDVYLNYTPDVVIVAKSPIDLVVTDPDGFIITKELSEVYGVYYSEYDADGDGKIEDILAIRKRKMGSYLIEVVPEPNTSPTDTYSLQAMIEGQTMSLAQDVQIQDIPSQPYEFESKLCYSDFDSDGNVDFADLAKLAFRWLEQNCNYPSWCEGTDLNFSGSVDLFDLAEFAEHWLEGL